MVTQIEMNKPDTKRGHHRKNAPSAFAISFSQIHRRIAENTPNNMVPTQERSADPMELSPLTTPKGAIINPGRYPAVIENLTMRTKANTITTNAMKISR